MEVTKQSLEQVTAAQYSQTPQARRVDREAQGTDFDELLQRKHQETSEPDRSAGQDGQNVRDREQAGEAAHGEQDAADAPEAGEVPEDAKAVLAAMLLQPQQTGEPEAAQAQSQPETAAVAALTAQGEGAQLAVDGMAQPEQAQAQPGQDDAAQQAPGQAAQGMPQAPEQARQTGESHTENAAQAPQAQAQSAAAPERDAAIPARAERSAARQDGEPDAQLVEAPVFQQVEDAVPVKVAEPVLNPENPLPIEGEEVPSRMAELFTRSVDNGDTIGVIRITPENLGPVTMTISRDAQGALHMALEALNPKTAALLEKHSANIERIAAESTHQDVHVEIRSEREQPFPENRQEDGNGQQQHQQQGRRQEQDAKEPAQDFMHRLRLGLTGEDE